MREGNPEICFANFLEESVVRRRHSRNLSEVRIKNWIRTNDWSYVHLSAITEICLKYQGSEVKEEDCFEVSVLTKMTDFWLPNSEDKEVAKKHHNFFNQMSDQQKRDIYIGTKEECEEVIRIIMLPEV